MNFKKLKCGINFLYKVWNTFTAFVKWCDISRADGYLDQDEQLIYEQ